MAPRRVRSEVFPVGRRGLVQEVVEDISGLLFVVVRVVGNAVDFLRQIRPPQNLLQLRYRFSFFVQLSHEIIHGVVHGGNLVEKFVILLLQLRVLLLLHLQLVLQLLVLLPQSGYGLVLVVGFRQGRPILLSIDFVFGAVDPDGEVLILELLTLLELPQFLWIVEEVVGHSDLLVIFLIDLADSFVEVVDGFLDVLQDVFLLLDLLLHFFLVLQNVLSDLGVQFFDVLFDCVRLVVLDVAAIDVDDAVYLVVLADCGQGRPGHLEFGVDQQEIVFRFNQVINHLHEGPNMIVGLFGEPVANVKEVVQLLQLGLESVAVHFIKLFRLAEHYKKNPN